MLLIAPLFLLPLGCRKVEAPLENTIIVCSDGQDNDGDGLVDCADPECYQRFPGCAGADADADGDGDIDWDIDGGGDGDADAGPDSGEGSGPDMDLGVQWVLSRPAGLAFTKSEITVAQYRACVNAGQCSSDGLTIPSSDGISDTEEDEHCNWGKAERDNYPLQCLDWSQANALCAWLGGRLPTEEELFAEASNSGEWDWPWGDTPEASCDMAVWSEGSAGLGCGRSSTWPVCSKPRGNSVSGLCDTSGNVWEWTSTDYNETAKMVCGGGWGSLSSGDLRAGLCIPNPVTNRHNDDGVRCVRSPH